MNLLKRFIHYYKPHRLIFALDMTSSFLVAAIGICYPIITRLVLNDFLPNNDFNGIIVASVILLVIYFIRKHRRCQGKNGKNKEVSRKIHENHTQIGIFWRFWQGFGAEK